MVLGKPISLLRPLGKIRRWHRGNLDRRGWASCMSWLLLKHGAGLSLAWLQVQPFIHSVRQTRCCSIVCSVYRQFAGYLLGCFGCGVHPLEVLVVRSAAQPGLPEVDPTREEEAAWPRFDAALQQSPDLAFAGQTTVAGEQGVLLTKNPGGADLDHRCPQVLVFLHGPDVPTYHCGSTQHSGSFFCCFTFLHVYMNIKCFAVFFFLLCFSCFTVGD